MIRSLVRHPGMNAMVRALRLTPFVPLLALICFSSDFLLLFAPSMLLLVLLLGIEALGRTRLKSRCRGVIAFTILALHAPLLVALGILAWALCSISPYFLPILLVAAGTLFWSLPIRILWIRLGVATVGTAIGATALLFLTAIMVQEPVHLPLKPPEHGKNGILTRMGTAAKRYGLVFSPNGRYLAVTHPLLPKMVRYDTRDLDHPLETVQDIDILSFSRYNPPGRILAAGWNRGLHILDSTTLTIIDTVEFQTGQGDETKFAGLVFDEKRERILLTRANGEILEISADDFALQRVFTPDALDTPLFKSAVDNVFIYPEHDRLLVTTDIGFVHMYELETMTYEGRRFVFGPQGNLVASRDGRAVFAASLFAGDVFKLSLDDLSVIDRIPVGGGGARYLAKIPETDILLVSNYFTGQVSFLDTEKREVVGEVTVGPRIKGLALMPNSSKCLVSHGLGLTIIDTAAVLAASPPLFEKPYPFPFYLLNAEFLRLAIDNYWRLDGARGVMILLSLVFMALAARLTRRPGATG